MENKKLVLCKIKKDKIVKYAWIDEKLAKFGTAIQIRDSKTKAVDRGWWVIRVKKGFTHEKITTQDDSEGISSRPILLAA